MEPIELDDSSGAKRFVTFLQAPEPSDLEWANTRLYGWGIVKRRLLSWTFYFFLLVIAFACQLALGFLAELEREQRLSGRQGDQCQKEAPSGSVRSCSGIY
jgi:hypothetical protein